MEESTSYSGIAVPANAKYKGPKPKQPLVLAAGFKEKPPSLVCYLCGREFGTASLVIHFKSCARAFHRKQSEMPESKRKPMPEPPSLPIPTLEDEPDDFEAYNEQAMAIFKGQMPKCTCGRTFGDYTKLQQHQTICKDHAAYLERQRLDRETAEAEKLRRLREEQEAVERALRDAELEAARLAAEAAEDDGRRRQLEEEKRRRKAAEEAAARSKAEEERKRREEEKAMLEALRRQQEEDARRNRKKFLRKGEGKQAIDERLRVDTEKALMQKRVRNYESCGVFTSGNTTVDEDDHWLLRDLAQKVAITEGNTSEDSPVNLKGAILNPDKGALELVQKAGKIGRLRQLPPVTHRDSGYEESPSSETERPKTAAAPSHSKSRKSIQPGSVTSVSEAAPTISASPMETLRLERNRFPHKSQARPKTSGGLPSNPTTGGTIQPRDMSPIRAPSVPRRPKTRQSTEESASGRATSPLYLDSLASDGRSSANVNMSSPPTRKSMPSALRELVAQHSPVIPVQQHETSQTGSLKLNHAVQAAATCASLPSPVQLEVDESQRKDIPNVSAAPIHVPPAGSSSLPGGLAKFCHECGIKYVDGAKFCHECGARRVGT